MHRMGVRIIVPMMRAMREAAFVQAAIPLHRLREAAITHGQTTSYTCPSAITTRRSTLG
jgi:hypothetical protein